MRLTLRTLLAYLDDILEPTQAKELGTKINESAVASTLVGRIREVMRRRRLGAPDVDGPDSKLDANTTAEYLDNTLPAAEVAAVEKLALESDVHLAEIAACHQILTLVRVEPVEISTESRQRMYALGGASPETNGSEVAEAAPVLPQPVKAGAREKEPVEIPEHLRPAPIGRRILVGSVFVVLVLIWIATIMIPTPVQNPNPIAKNDASKTPVDGGAVEPKPEEKPAEPQAKAEVPANENEPIAAEVEPSPAEPMEVPAEPTEETEVEVAVTAPVPEVVPIVPVATPEPPPPGIPSAPQVAAPEILYTSPTGILLWFDSQRSDWFVMPHRSVVRVGETLASPVPFDARLEIGGELLRVYLQGDTVATPSAAGDISAIDFGVKQGRLVLESAPEFDPATSEGADLAVTVGNQSWRLELLVPATIAGLEIDPADPSALEQRPAPDSFRGVLFVRTGSIRAVNGGEEITVAAGETVSLTPGEARRPIPASQIPDWVSTEPAARSSVVQRYSSLFEREFVSEQKLSLNLPSVVFDRRPQISQLATRALGLMGLIDGLTAALVQGEHEETRQAAIAGIRRWMASTPDAGPPLRSELSKYFRDNSLTSVHTLLWGYGSADAKDPTLSQELIQRLDDEQLPVRELAIYQLNELTGLRYEYHANLPESQRKNAMRRWEQHLSKNGGALVNPGGPPPAAP